MALSSAVLLVNGQNCGACTARVTTCYRRPPCLSWVALPTNGWQFS